MAVDWSAVRPLCFKDAGIPILERGYGVLSKACFVKCDDGSFNLICGSPTGPLYESHCGFYTGFLHDPLTDPERAPLWNPVWIHNGPR